MPSAGKDVDELELSYSHVVATKMEMTSESVDKMQSLHTVKILQQCKGMNY